MEVKSIDYFNPPICESVILVAAHSAWELLMGLGATCLGPRLVQLNFQLESARRRGGRGVDTPQSPPPPPHPPDKNLAKTLSDRAS